MLKQQHEPFLTANLRTMFKSFQNFLIPEIPKMCDPILVTVLKMQPHYSQSSRKNATPSSGTSPVASYKEVPPPPLLPLWQNKSLCETIGMKICHLYSHSDENQVIFMILMRNVLHKHSICKWKLRRWKSSAYPLFRFRRMLFFRPRLNILIFLPILG